MDLGLGIQFGFMIVVQPAPLTMVGVRSIVLGIGYNRVIFRCSHIPRKIMLAVFSNSQHRSVFTSAYNIITINMCVVRRHSGVIIILYDNVYKPRRLRSAKMRHGFPKDFSRIDHHTFNFVYKYINQYFWSTYDGVGITFGFNRSSYRNVNISTVLMTVEMRVWYV